MSEIGNLTEQELFDWVKSLANVMGWELTKRDPGSQCDLAGMSENGDLLECTRNVYHKGRCHLVPVPDTQPSMEALLRLVTGE